MVQFDSTGTYITPFFNYHDSPHAFVRLILGLTSTDESVLGLDTSIKWTIKNGIKVSGTISIPQDNVDKPLVYRLKQVRPVFTRASISGRRTTCWLATQQDGKSVLIKDAWHTATRVPEHVYLKSAKDIAGIAKMIYYRALGHTSGSRPTQYANRFDFHDREKLRIVLEAHGKNLAGYGSRYELMAAVRDTIRCKSHGFLCVSTCSHLLSAHRLLYARGILHRDISLYNLLLGDDDDQDAIDRIYGFLIDLDMAIFHDKRERGQVSKQIRSVRLY